MTKVGRIGWGVTPPPEPPVVVMPVGGRVTPVLPDDGITIPRIPEGAVRVGGPTVVAVDPVVTNVTAEDSPDAGQGTPPLVLGWTNPDADH